MKQFLLLFISIVFSTFLFGQGNMITVDTQLPYSITICGASQNVNIELINPSPFNMSNVVLKVTMPVGLTYVAGSISGANELNISNLSVPEFSLNNLSTQATRNITFRISANCQLINFISQGNLVAVESKINYTTNNNISSFDQNTSYLYFVKQPNLSIISITNQTYSGNIGNIFTRCITITNGGFGELSQFTYTHTHGNGIKVNSVSIGTWNSSGNTETITFDGSNFSTTGNHNALFENAEVITICETIEILNCVSVFSNYEVKWGCEGQICQNSISTANVIFPNFTPNLLLTPTANTNFCLGTGNVNQPSLRLINNGLGDAYNVFLDIFQSTGTTYTTGMRSNIDPTSFTMKVNSSAPVSITPTQTFTTTAQYCLAANPIGRVYLNIPVINSGDTVLIKWNYINCCSDVCGGTRTLSGWRYQGNYKSICQNSYVIPNTWGYSYRDFYGEFSNNLSPSYISTGETKNFSFIFSSYANSYPNTTGRYWKFVVTLPPCLTYAGNFVIERYNGTQYWNPTSVNVVGNVLTAIFNSNPPWDLFQALVKLDLTANCTNPGCVEGDNIVNIKSFYAPSGSCACEVSVSCLDVKVGVVCPVVCEGFNNKGFDTYRSSYGLPDNNNDGLADLSPAVLDFNKIRRDRAMFGDTVTTVFKGIIKTSVSNPSWNYFYTSSSISNGNYLGFLDGLLEIYQHSTGNVFTCPINSSTVVNAGTSRKFSFDISPVTLITLGLLPSGFTLNNDDSISFKVRYKVNSNAGGAILDCYIQNEIYVSNVLNPSAQNRFTCNHYEGRFSIISYYFTNWGPDNFNVNTCNNVVISQNYYLSIGSCCQNYAGGNLFPYEYRNWAHISKLTVIVPSGYQFISAQFNQTRTSGTVAINTSSWIPIIPVNQYSDTLVFNVEQYFETFGGTLPLSDDGFYGTLQVTIAPTCNVVPNIASNIAYLWDFAPTPYLLNSNTLNSSNTSNQDQITYQGPNIFLQSNLPSVLAFNNQVNWNVFLSNTTNINAINTWFAGDQSTGVTILEVKDVDNNVVIPPVGNIYQIGVLTGNTTRNFKITATYTSCFPSQMMLHAGWNCNAGYPLTIADYPCTTKKLLLSLAPQIPNLMANITSPITTIDLCDTTGYLVEGINVQLGTAYNLKLKVILPSGVTIIPGSSELSYPFGAPFVIISNPVNVGGTQWLYDISTINSQIGTDGLKGILDTNFNSVKITFRVITDCAYTSGSVIGFNFHGQSHCGYNTGQEVSMSSELAITGATAPYLTDININTSFVSPCADDSTGLRIKIVNNGPLFIGNTDSIIIKMPEGIFMIPNSYNPVYNSPLNPVPTIYVLNNQQYLAWKLPEFSPAGDSVIFEIAYYSVPEDVNCGILNIEATTFSTRNLMCQLIGQNCGIKVNTGSVQVPIYIYEAFLSLLNASAYAVPNGSTGETVFVNYAINNVGEAINANHKIYISYYHDTEGNQILSSADIFLAVDSLNIFVDTNSTNIFTSHFNVSAGNSCKLIIYIDTTFNSCVCNPSQIYTTIPLLNAGPDTTLCSGQSTYIGLPAINGYTYQWQPATGLNNASLAQPVFSGTNNGTTPIILTYILTTNRISCTTKDTVKVTILPLPVAEAGFSDTICAGDSTLLIATGGISYIWSNNVLNDSTVVSPLLTTTYIVTVTDNNGCSKTDNVIIKVNQLPSVDAGTNASICRGDSTLLSASGGISYLWSPSLSLTANNIFNPVAFPDQTTTYTVTVTANNSCKNTDNVVVTIYNNPLISHTYTNITCQGFNNGTITANPYNGLYPYNFSWNTAPVQDTQTATGLSPGITYTVTVIDGNGCLGKDSLMLSEPEALTMMTFSFSDALCFSSCNGGAEALVSGGTIPYQYIWSPLGTGVNINTLNTICAGNYSLTVKDSNNCQIDTSFTINQPDILTYSYSTTDVLCHNGTDGEILISNNGGTSPYTYIWLPSVSTDTVASNLSAGIYTITITDSLLCDTVFNVIINQPPLMVLSTSGNDTVCIDENFTISCSASGGVTPYIFTWDNNLGHNDSIYLTSSHTTTYTVFVTDSNNCITNSQSLEVYVYPVVAVTADFIGDSAICLNNSAQLTALATGGNGGPYTYTWNQNIGVQLPPVQVIPVQTTNYIVTATDNCGSPVGIDSVTIIVNPLPDVNFNANNTRGCEPLEVNFTDLSTPDIASWQWHFGDPLSGINNTSTQQNPTHLYQNPGTYNVILMTTTIFGCEGSLTLTNFVNVYPLPIADFTFHPPFADIENPIIYFINQSSGDSIWSWDFGDPASGNLNYSYEKSPYHLYNTPDTFSILLIVSSDKGCIDSTYKNVIYRPEYTFYVPNAFTPNGDGLNDLFGPEGIGMNADDYKMYIYDRWGGLIFKTNDINKYWDGKIKDSDIDQPPGVYVWVILFSKTSDYDRHLYRYTGQVTLIR